MKMNESAGQGASRLSKKTPSSDTDKRAMMGRAAARHRRRDPLPRISHVSRLPSLAPPQTEEEDVEVDDAQAVIERLHMAMGDFVKGDAGSALELFSQQEDVTLGNPFGPFVRGWERVSETAAAAATIYRDGEAVGFERVAAYATGDLACFVEVERYRAKIGGSEELTAVALRVTSVLRREDDGWRIVSRHADPITVARPPESVIQHG